MDAKAVISKVHARGQMCVYLRMQAQLVAYMGEITILRAHFF